MTRERRSYQMKRRAELQEQTRLRIVESAVQLHGTIGPSRTSISAVAEHAGVRRSTVYRHFTNEAALFDACSTHWAAANPPPNLDLWATIADPDERLSVALDELYAYYQQTESMLDHLFREENASPLIHERFATFHNYIATARDSLMAGRTLRGIARRRTQAALGHAIAFSTWKSLVRDQQLNRNDAASLAHTLAATAAPPPDRHPNRERPDASHLER